MVNLLCSLITLDVGMRCGNIHFWVKLNHHWSWWGKALAFNPLITVRIWIYQCNYRAFSVQRIRCCVRCMKRSLDYDGEIYCLAEANLRSFYRYKCYFKGYESESVCSQEESVLLTHGDFTPNHRHPFSTNLLDAQISLKRYEYEVLLASWFFSGHCILVWCITWQRTDLYAIFLEVYLIPINIEVLI